jgi:phage baseplate assembly protein W
MTTPLIDNAGVPVLDAQGNFMYISGINEIKQQMINAFSTQLGSEPLFEEYGFDMISLYQNINIDGKIMLKMLTYDCLNPRIMRSIKSIDSCEASVTGTTGFVDLTLTTIEGKIQTLYQIGDVQ